VAAFVLFHPFVFLRSYYEQETRAGRTNSPYLHTVDQIISKRGPDEIVLLDRPPDESSVASGGGWVSSIFRLSLAVNGVPYRFIDLSGDELLDPKTRCREQLVILALRRPELNRQIVERFGLRRVELPPSGQPAAGAYPFYRLERLPQAPQDC
jgi:hypothetical protein